MVNKTSKKIGELFLLFFIPLVTAMHALHQMRSFMERVQRKEKSFQQCGFMLRCRKTVHLV